MSYKLSMMLSLIFVVIFSLFAVDLIAIQNTYSLLDSKSINISYYLARSGDVTDDSIAYIEREYNVDFILLSDNRPRFGDYIKYQLQKTYHPISGFNAINITLERMAIVGYYN